MVDPEPLRAVFFGTPAFALPTLEALLASRHEVVGVVTQPDRARGRGQKTSDSPVKARAIEAGLPLFQPDRLKQPDFLSAFTNLGADVGVIAAYGKLLPEVVFSAPRFGMINVHASLLPRYRGAAPVHRAVMAGERETGVTIMRIVKALDAGPMLAAERLPISDDDTSVDVEGRLAVLGARLLVHVLDRLPLGGVTETPQDDRDATYAPPLTKDDALVDWSRPAEAVHNQIRGLHPWPQACSFLGGRRLILLRSAVVDRQGEAQPGAVVAARADDFRVAAAPGAVRLIEVQPEGKRPMTAREFLAGRRIAPGDRFGNQ
jgi:methionyl-tRNA formyltransferase